MKKTVSLICQVSDYKKGGSEKIIVRTSDKPIDPYATFDDELANYEKNYGEKNFNSKNRVILIDCRELDASEN